MSEDALFSMDEADWPDVVERKDKRIATLESEVAALKDQLFRWTEMHFKEGEGAEATGEGPFVQVLAEELVKVFKDAGAVNCLEFKMYHKELGSFFLTIQRQQGKTPMDLRNEAVEENEALKKQVSDYQDQIRSLKGKLHNAKVELRSKS
jgi:hypothetical protein